MALWGAVHSHGNLIYHSAGWGEGGLVADFEKVIVDCEMLQAMSQVLKPISFERLPLSLKRMKRWSQAAISLARPTRWSGLKTPSTAHSCQTGQIMKTGVMLVRGRQRNAPWISGQRSLTTIRPRLDPARLEEMQAYIANRKQQIGVASRKG